MGYFGKWYFTILNLTQDKGTIENRIGLIRRFFSKKTDLRKISHQRIKEVENLINNRAVRKFKSLIPQQKLNKYCVAFIS